MDHIPLLLPQEFPSLSALCISNHQATANQLQTLFPPLIIFTDAMITPEFSHFLTLQSHYQGDIKFPTS